MFKTFIKHFILALGLVLSCATSNGFANVGLQQFENSDNKLHFNNIHHSPNISVFDFCAEEDQDNREDELVSASCSTPSLVVASYIYRYNIAKCNHTFNKCYTIVAPQISIYLRIRNFRV